MSDDAIFCTILIFGALAVGAMIGHMIDTWFFPNTTLGHDSPTDPDSSSADRRDTL